MKIQRSDIRKSNPYYLPKHRYLELKHYCLQYPDWKRALHDISILGELSGTKINCNSFSDPVTKVAELREPYRDRIKLIEQVAEETDSVLADYILTGVTRECTYEYLKTMLNIPISRKHYYILYRKFFFILSQFR